jgi:hypothetical protein
MVENLISSTTSPTDLADLMKVKKTAARADARIPRQQQS